MAKFYAVLFVLFSALFVIAVSNGSQKSIVVQTEQGALDGVVSESRNGNPYYSFKGVPYAEYPGRFQVATQFAKWDGVRPAKEFGSICAQVDLLETTQLSFSGLDDCLFLNIHTPSISKDAGLATIFWIHGGAFTYGSGNDFDGKYFADEGIIAISINYRLGPLGFISFGDNEISGNIGMKDQLLALKWVKKNINSFGGDPNKVTIAGYSEGGSSVHYHMLSPQSKGLFRGGISQSGTATAFWARQRDPRDTAVKLASALDCPIPDEESSSTKETVACLKSKSDEEVVAAQVKLKEWFTYPIVLFAPVIELEAPDSFLVESPESILQKGNFNRVNWIAGINEDEGAILDIPIMTDRNLTDKVESDWFTIAPILFGYQHIPLEERDSISAEIREAYFDKFEIDEFTWHSFRILFTDRYWLEPLETSIRLQSQHSRVYPYVFRFSGDHSQVHKLYGVTGDHGVAHGDEMQYLYPGGSIGATDYSDAQSVQLVEFSRKFVKLLSSFVKDMKPSGTWEKEIVWKSMFLSKPTRPTPYYEIAIETGIWDEDVASRLQTILQHIPSEASEKQRIKTEL